MGILRGALDALAQIWTSIRDADQGNLSQREDLRSAGLYEQSKGARFLCSPLVEMEKIWPSSPKADKKIPFARRTDRTQEE